MERDGRSLSPALRRLVVAGPFVLCAGLALLFDVVRDIPADYDCGEQPAAGHDAAVAAYASGALALHLVAIAWALGAIVLLSARGGRAPGRGPFGIGLPTAAALTALVVATLLVLLTGGGAAFLVLLPLLLAAFGLAAVAEPFGPAATGLAAAALLLAAGARSGRVADTGRTVAPRVALWLLALLAGAHLLIVAAQGSGPFFC